MFLNCDLGEGYGPWEKGDDAAAMPYLDWANIACGGHAGDGDTMARTLELSIEHGVRAGAHPGYADRRNFGRVRLDLSTRSLVREVQAQIGALRAIATAVGADLHHVKPHGALYNAMMAEDDLLIALAEGVAAVEPELVFVLQETPDRGRHERALAHTGLRLAFEVFADRRYASDGRLESRSIPGSVITDPDLLVKHVKGLLGGTVETPSGTLPVAGDTLCVHGDNPSAIAALQRIRELIPRPS